MQSSFSLISESIWLMRNEMLVTDLDRVCFWVLNET